MKHSILVLLLSVAVAGLVTAQSVDAVLREADRLIDERQYDSAFTVLEESDVESTRVLARQIDIVTEYYVTSIMHQMFALADLSPGQSLTELRRSGGEYQMRLFDPAAIAEPILQRSDAPGLAAALARYYEDAISMYGDEWVMPRQETQQKVVEYAQRAHAGGAADALTLSIAGAYLLHAGKYSDAAELLKASVEMNPEHAPAHYNYAISLAETGRLANGLEHAERAGELYESLQYRADSYVLLGQFHNALGQPAEAFAAFQKAARTAPGYHYPHQLLLPQYLEKNDAESARESAAIIIGFDPTNPTALQITMSLYARAQALDEFVTAAGEIADEYVENPEARGNILFHKASGHFQIGQVAEGRRTIQEARELFSKVYDANHPVFAEIERVLADTE